MSGADAPASSDGGLGSPPSATKTKVDAAASGAAAHSPVQTLRWLEDGERGGERVAIVSYPRSGNSLMRGLLEKITGVYTGCDTRPDRSLSQELQQYGMKGEVRDQANGVEWGSYSSSYHTSGAD